MTDDSVRRGFINAGGAVRSFMEPVSDQRAAFLYEEIRRHRNRKRTGRCRICSRASCQAIRQATAELVMAGRDTAQPLASRWRRLFA